MTLNADGSFAYEPDPDYNGTDSFAYRASDGIAESETAFATIVVEAVNDPPTPPAGIAATPGDGMVTLIWEEGADPDGTVVGYKLYRGTSSGVYGESVDVQGTEYADEPLENGVTYWYAVTSIDDLGAESGFSPEVSATPAEPSYDAYAVGDPTVAFGTLGGDGVAGATVAGDWYIGGTLLAGGSTGVTGAGGAATIESPSAKAASGDTFTFVVTGVETPGLPYDPEANVESQDSIVVP